MSLSLVYKCYMNFWHDQFCEKSKFSIKILLLSSDQKVRGRRLYIEAALARLVGGASSTLGGASTIGRRDISERKAAPPRRKVSASAREVGASTHVVGAFTRKVGALVQSPYLCTLIRV